MKETEKNLALRVEDTDSADSFLVYGRGGTDDASRIAPKTLMTLEECMEYIQQDECIEVTPKNVRMRKVILNEGEGKKVQKSMSVTHA